ncbi:MAG: hypothetical protein IJX13_04200 [Clostridia bacterium]|nr:hypothetical protein [Clostridia bacterium]
MRTFKPIQRLLFVSLCILLLTLVMPLGVSAQDTELSYEEMPGEYLEFIELFPDEITQLLPEGLFSSDSEEVAGAVGEISDFSYLLRAALSLVGLKLGDCLKLLASVIGILLLSATLRALQSSFRQGSVGSAFSLLSSLIITLLLLKKGYDGMQGVNEYFSMLTTLARGSLPLLGTLYAMGGNVSAATASSAGLTVFLSVMEEIVGKTILPFCGICLAFALVNAVDPSIRTGTLATTLKKNYTTVLTFLMTLLLAMLSAQTTLGAKSDTLAMKGVKFATGNMIPIVGGSVSELLKTVSAGIGFLRGSVGICAVLLLLLLLLPTLIELFLLRLTWQLCASCADLLGCDTEKRLLEEFASINGFLIAAACICSSVLFLSFLLLLHCASAIA